MNILITGYSGFVGKQLVDSLINEGYGVRTVSLRKTKIDKIDFGDIFAVIHLSALVHQMKRVQEDDYYKINKDQTVQLALYAKKNRIKHFIFFSSTKVLGEATENDSFFNELSECKPQNAYGKSKREAEIELEKLNDRNFNVAIIRPPLVYGGDAKGNIKSLIKLISIFHLIPFGEIDNKRSMVSIDNLVNFVLIIIKNKSSGIFHITDDELLSTTDFVNLIAKGLNKSIFNFKLPWIFVKIIRNIRPSIYQRIWGSLIIDSRVSKESLDFKCIQTPEEGINKMIQSKEVI